MGKPLADIDAGGGTTSADSRPVPADTGDPRIPDPPGPAEAVQPSGKPSAGFGPRAAWPALALYAGLRVVAVLVLWRVAEARGSNLGRLLTAWDGGHYLLVAMNGYHTAITLKPDGSPTPTNLAFFPLYPGLIAALDPVLPGDLRFTAIAVSWAAGVAAAWGLYAVGAHLRDRRTGIVLAGLWAVVPHAVVESMGYTETLFTALAAWSLFAVMRRRWLTAGVLCLAAGLTRSVAIALIAAVGLAALVAVCRRRDGWRPWVGGALAPLGFLAFAAWVGDRLGRFDGYVYAQRVTWHASYDAGRYALTEMIRVLSGPQELGFYVTTLVVVAALALLVLLALHRAPWPLVVYAAVMFAAVVGVQGYYHTMARHLLPAFPLLLPVAYALAAARRSTVIVVFVLLAALSTWYGVYLCLIWGHSP
jgi:hypothetical protein